MKQPHANLDKSAQITSDIAQQTSSLADHTANNTADIAAIALAQGGSPQSEIPTTDSIDSLLGRQYRSQKPLTTLFQLLGFAPWQLMGLYLIFLLKNSPVLWIPIATAAMVDAIAQPDGETVLWWYTISIVVTLMINVPAHVWYSFHISRAARRVEQRLRSGLIRRLQHLTMSFHHQQRTGALHTKVVRDVEQVEQLISQMAHMGLQAVNMLLFAVVISLLDEPVMALLFLVIAPLVIVLRHFFRQPIKQNNRKFRHRLEYSTTRINEMLNMLPVTRAHAVEDHEIDHADRYLGALRKRGHRLDMVNALFQSSTWVSMQGIQIICLVVTIIMAMNEVLSVGDVILYQTLFGYFIHSVAALLNLYPILAKGLESVSSLGEILECPDLEDNKDKQVLGHVRGEIEFRHAGFTYPNRDNMALDDINLHIQPGTSVAVVGASGSGKSTLVSMLIGFQRLNAGELYCDGVASKDLDFRSWRRGLAVVSQQVVMFSGTLRQNICYGMEAPSERRLQEVIQQANLNEVIEALSDGLDTQVGENGVQLSGGQRQRIAIARALIRDPQVIILDEATSALDVHSEQAVQQAIDQLIVGRTTIIVAHRLSTIRQADWVVVMEQGRIIEQGPREALASSGGAFTQLIQLQH